MKNRIENGRKKWKFIGFRRGRKEKKQASVGWYIMLGFLLGGIMSDLCQIHVRAGLEDGIQSEGAVIYEVPEGNGSSFYSSDLRWLASEIERQNGEAEDLAELCR